MSQASEDELREALMTASRAMSTATVLFHHAIAEHVGLSATDHKYLDLLAQMGPVPAGKFAEATGLTTGAVTGVVDRLERAGLARRERDPNDRRVVVIKPLVDQALRRLDPTFRELGSKLSSLYDDYTNEELEVILDYTRRATSLLRELTMRLRGTG